MQELEEAYRRDGFAIVEDAFNAVSIASLRAAALDIVDRFDVEANKTVFKTNDRDAGRDAYFFDSAEAVHCFLEEGALNASGDLIRPKHLAINKLGHAMHDHNPVFAAFCRQPVIAKALRAVGYRAPALWQTMYIFKQPGIGGEVRWHQDASYLISGSPGVVGLWVAIEDATVDNGCLWMQPGQHRSPLREVYHVDWQAREGVLRTIDDTPWCADGAAVPLEVAAGSMVLFSDRMPHYSCQNRSENSRHAFTMHFAEQGAHWSEKNWLQRKTLQDFLV